MAVRKILEYPEDKSSLRKKSEPVPGVNRRTRKLIRDLKDTLKAHPEGVGLAAPQIAEHARVVIVRLGAGDGEESETESPITLVNPEILEAFEPRKDFDGCLSFPGLFGETVRPHSLRVSGLDETGEPFDRVFTGFDAVVVHHEIDHLDGVLFIDHIEDVGDLYRLVENDHGELVRVPVSFDLV